MPKSSVDARRGMNVAQFQPNLLFCTSKRTKKPPQKATIVGIYRQHRKGLGIQTAETAVVLDSCREFLSDTEIAGLSTESALRRELGEGAVVAAAKLSSARTALQAMDEADSMSKRRFCFCRSVWHAEAKQDEVLRCFQELGAVLREAEKSQKMQAEKAYGVSAYHCALCHERV